MSRCVVLFLVAGVVLTVCGGCAPRQRAAGQVAAQQAMAEEQAAGGLADPRPVEAVDAVCVPPAGWVAQPLEQETFSRHLFWVSRSGATAYGVMRIWLPLPMGENMTLNAFLREMRRREGRAELIERRDDEVLGGVRFVAEGSRYRIRCNMVVVGFRAWFVYAGTRRDLEIAARELELAERGREQTKLGLEK